MSQPDISILAREFGAIVGADHVRPPLQSEALAVQLVTEPRSAEEIAQIVRKCEADALTLAPIATAHTLAQIRRVPAAVGVSLARMARILDYEPDDMTVVAEAGVTLDTLNRLTAPRGQRLPVDPAHADVVTLGVLVAAAKAGPIRLSEGIVRDLLIGIRFVGHEGRIVHGGGRVVKNVAGYDLMKVMTGSYGTLGIITETTFKVRPIPANYTLAIASCARAADALESARKADAAAPLIHLEVLSPALSAPFGHAGRFVVMAGFGGSAPEVAAQRESVAAALGNSDEILDGAAATAVYERMRELDFADAAIVAQLAVLPASLAQALQDCGAEFRAHAGCGVARIFLAGERNADEVRSAVAHWREIAHGARGHLRIIAARPELREGLNFFDEPPAPALKLMRSLKLAFDPHGVFNPACFVGGL